MPAVIEFHDMETAFIQVKMDVSRFEIRRAGLPDLRFRIEFLRPANRN